MSDTYETTAVFADEKTLVLDEALPIAGGRVKIWLEPIEEEVPPLSSDFLIRLQEIHRALFNAGFIPPTREAVDAELEQSRDAWDR